jgi:hypothetical protein
MTKHHTDETTNLPEPDENEDTTPNPPYDLPEDDFQGIWS